MPYSSRTHLRPLHNRYGHRPAGGDQRYEYIPFEHLSDSDKQQVLHHRYPHSTPWLGDMDYHYPVDKKGRLVHARRYIHHAKAEELHKAHNFAAAVSGRGETYK